MWRENPSSLSPTRTSDQRNVSSLSRAIISRHHWAIKQLIFAASKWIRTGIPPRPLFTCLIRGIVRRVRTMCHHFPRCGEKLQMGKTERVGHVCVSWLMLIQFTLLLCNSRRNGFTNSNGLANWFIRFRTALIFAKFAGFHLMNVQPWKCGSVNGWKGVN